VLADMLTFPEHREGWHYPATMDLQMPSIGRSSTVAIDSGQGSRAKYTIFIVSVLVSWFTHGRGLRGQDSCGAS
jgi:hypothetical protein